MEIIAFGGRARVGNNSLGGSRSGRVFLSAATPKCVRLERAFPLDGTVARSLGDNSMLYVTGSGIDVE